MSSTPRDAKLPPILIGYALLLLQFILLGLFLLSLAVDWSNTTRLILAVAWLALLVASLVALTAQTFANRRREATGALPSPHLLVPTEHPDRVSRYMNLYRTDDAVAREHVSA